MGAKSFREKTRGLATSNYSHSLPDGTDIWMSKSFVADYKNMTYEDGIDPEYLIHQENVNKDMLLFSAIAWLRLDSQPI